MVRRSTNAMPDRMSYSNQLFRHFDRISEYGCKLFDQLPTEEGQQLPTMSSRMRSYMAMIIQAEGFLWPNLSPDYFRRVGRGGALAKGESASFYYSQIVLRALMTAAHSKGYLFKEVEEMEAEDDGEDSSEDSES